MKPFVLIGLMTAVGCKSRESEEQLRITQQAATTEGTDLISPAPGLRISVRAVRDDGKTKHVVIQIDVDTALAAGAAKPSVVVVEANGVRSALEWPAKGWALRVGRNIVTLAAGERVVERLEVAGQILRLPSKRETGSYQPGDTVAPPIVPTVQVKP